MAVWVLSHISEKRKSEENINSVALAVYVYEI